MYGKVRIQLIQVYSQTSTSTALPRSPSGVSGPEFTHRCALSAGSRLTAPARHEPATMPAVRSGRMVLTNSTPRLRHYAIKRSGDQRFAKGIHVRSPLRIVGEDEVAGPRTSGMAPVASSCEGCVCCRRLERVRRRVVRKRGVAPSVGF